MKLRNRKTGEIGYTAVLRSKAIVVMDENAIQLGSYTSLAELNEEWEDYEEPKTHWMIDTSVLDPVREIAGMPYEIDKEIGNWFSTKEEAELAVRKLKAWKRLKDDGITYSLDEGDGTPYIIIHSKEERGPVQKVLRVLEDLTLLFGGEE